MSDQRTSKSKLSGPIDLLKIDPVMSWWNRKVAFHGFPETYEELKQSRYEDLAPEQRMSFEENFMPVPLDAYLGAKKLSKTRLNEEDDWMVKELFTLTNNWIEDLGLQPLPLRSDKVHMVSEAVMRTVSQRNNLSYTSSRCLFLFGDIYICRKEREPAWHDWLTVSILIDGLVHIMACDEVEIFKDGAALGRWGVCTVLGEHHSFEIINEGLQSLIANLLYNKYTLRDRRFSYNTYDHRGSENSGALVTYLLYLKAKGNQEAMKEVLLELCRSYISGEGDCGEILALTQAQARLLESIQLGCGAQSRVHNKKIDSLWPQFESFSQCWRSFVPVVP